MLARLTLPIFALGLTLSTSTSRRSADCQELTSPRDSGNAAWKAIGVQYWHLADAMKRKDLDALFALYVPDFQATTPSGEVWSRERSLAYQRGLLTQVREIRHISNTIIRIRLCGADSATATVLQTWYRTQLLAGQVRRVETNAVQDEHWVKTSGGWKRGNIDHVIHGVALVDGKRVNIDGPWNPDAPEYDPYHPKPDAP